MDLIEAEYPINDVVYTIIDTADIHQRLQTDPGFAEEYVATNGNCLEFQPSKTSDDQADSGTFVWKRNNILLLLQEYRLRADKFRDVKIKKKELWREICLEFKKNGYQVTEDILDKKFRNLKKTYIKIYDNNKKSSSGRGKVSWEYFEIFDEIFSKNDSASVGDTLSSMTFENASALALDDSQAVHAVYEDCEVIPEETLPSTEIPGELVPLNTSEQNCTDSAESKRKNPSTMRQKKTGQKRLAEYRLKILQEEKDRVAEIKLLRQAIERSNVIQDERNKILKLLVQQGVQGNVSSDD